MFKYLLIIGCSIMILMACSKSTGGDNNNILVINNDTNKLVTLTETDYRPLYHFTPSRNWMNDPNGLIYNKGVYHLFYQYNPNGNVWGPMNWGHATSTDLFNWQDQSIALTPDNLGTIFSGSAVIDTNNTAGLKTGSENPMIAIFTQNGSQQIQSIAYSNDAGNNWNKYNSNPVLPNPGLTDYRDPKVFWYEPTNNWIMVLAAGDRIKIYSSINLLNWVFEIDFGVGIGAHGGVWECPDLFPLPVLGTNSTKWVMLISLNGGPNGGTATQYFVGDFDGKNFTPNSSTSSWIDYGTDNYAGGTYNNIPNADGRRIFIGWMSNWSYAQAVPTTTWRSTMTIPRALSLVSIGANYLLKSTPIVELANYKANNSDTVINNAVSSVKLSDNKTIKSGSYELDFSVDLAASNTMLLALGNASEKLYFSYDNSTGYLIIDRSASGKVDFNSQMKQKIYCPFIPKTGKLTDFKIMVDKTSIEIFINSGEQVMTALFFPNYQYNTLNLLGNGSASVISNFKLVGINKSINR